MTSMPHNLDRIPLISLMTLAGTWGAEGAPTILINRIGWPADAPKTVLVDAPGIFQVVDAQGSLVAEGALAKAPADLAGSWWIGRFDQVKADGMYHVVCGNATSPWFAIGAPARAAYRTLADALVAGFRSRRAPVAGGPGVGAEDGIRSDDGRHQDYGGGWFDADDTRKFSFTVAIGCEALSLASSRGQGAVDSAAALEEAAWGVEFLVKCQDPAGWFIYGADHPTPFNAKKAFDTLPSRVYIVEPHHPTAQWRCIGALTAFALAVAAQPSPAPRLTVLAAQAQAAALRGRDHMQAESATWRTLRDPVRRHRSKTSDMRADPVDAIEAELFARVSLHRLAGSPADLSRAHQLAQRRAALQVIEPVAGISGMHRYGEDDPEGNPQGLAYHVPKIGGALPWIALTELARQGSGEAWRICLARVADGYLVPISARNAFDHVPFGVFAGPGPAHRRLSDDLHYRIFKSGPAFPFTSGRSAVMLNEAAGLAVAARDQGRPEWTRLAWRQLDFVLGGNPYGHMPRGLQSITIGGRERLVIGPEVTVQNGVLSAKGTDAMEDQMVKPAGWPGEEIWLPNSSALLLAVVELAGDGGGR
ncbi:MAG: hypothetical protein RLZZ127_2332 [Planctomycetota bacterium]|jgi:hypothetical protein